MLNSVMAKVREIKEEFFFSSELCFDCSRLVYYRFAVSFFYMPLQTEREHLTVTLGDVNSIMMTVSIHHHTFYFHSAF